ncbi:MAG: lytic transglycosylase domain-containing protein [Thermoanaerobaculia bacterium]
MDWRVVCSCQVHARRPSPWRGALRLAARGAAVLLGVPLALAAIDMPGAMRTFEDLRPTKTPAPSHSEASSLPIFTTESVKRQFLNAEQPLTLEVFKENYFSTHVPFGAIIFREARKNDLPPELVAAMVHTESDFRPGLVSHKTAQGLMQIVPATAALLGVDDPFDPEKNIAAGTKYYRYLLDRFDDETMALAAYNAGEGNVARYGGIPPFAETRDYISKVNRRTRRYRDGFRNSYITSLRMRRDAH